MLATLAAPAVAQAQERITAFEAEVRIAGDGSLLVEESIEVVSAGERIRRGIFRDLPLRSLIPPGFNHIAGFELERVERDGAPSPWFAQPLDAGLRIYVGEEGRLLPDGAHRYLLAYRTDRQLLHRAGEDELYWNVTGDAWDFPIERAAVTVHLPAGLEALRVAGYTGRPGEAGEAFRLVESAPGRVRLETTRALAPGEGFTVAVVWPAGAVARPDAAARVLGFAADNLGTLAGALLTLVLLAYFLLAWHRLGRDPEKGVVYPQFDPPPGLSAVGAGYVWHQGFGLGFSGNRALTVALTSLATKGALRIAEAGKGVLSLERTGKTPEALPPGEKAVLQALFGKGQEPTLRLGKAYEPRMGEAKSALGQAFGGEFARSFFRANLGYWLLGAGLALLAVLAALLPEARTEETLILVLVLIPFAVAFAAGATLFLLSALEARTAGRSPWRRLRHRLVRLALAAACLLPLADLALFASGFVAPMALLVAGTAVILAILFWSWLKAPTRMGRQTLDALEGYRLYLSVAEGERLEQAGREPAITEALFEQHLPYAMALGVEEAWSEKVAAKLAASAGEPGGSPYRPRWYERAGSSGDGPAALSRSLTRSLGGAAAVAATRPSSSSGGASGGSSGGGGGGGGGGGW
ncbi:MAG: DUF2207 domain-containing protein [Tistlia sp.]|uniref:DUF2207 domain-containing protein n=1 Tax=Tistlia sp. TaxID=3057121 RepID=UPI0034A40B64